MNKNLFIQAARSYVGTRYRHQGRLPGIALDCAGVVVCAARAAGLEPEDVFGYKQFPNGGELTRSVARYCDVASTIEPGDVIVFAWDVEPQHLGICTADGVMVHAYAGVKKVAEHRLDDWWLKLVVNILRPRFTE